MKYFYKIKLVVILFFVLIKYFLKYHKKFNVSVAKSSVAQSMFLTLIGKNSSIKIGHRFSCRKNFYLQVVNGKINIGNNVFFNNGASLNCLNEIVIGDNCLFGENVKIYDHNHSFSSKQKLIREQEFKTGLVLIGSNCWIGSNVILLKGANIGNNCIIGAGCIISTSIPDDSVVRVNQELSIERRY